MFTEQIAIYLIREEINLIDNDEHCFNEMRQETEHITEERC